MSLASDSDNRSAVPGQAIVAKHGRDRAERDDAERVRGPHRSPEVGIRSRGRALPLTESKLKRPRRESLSWKLAEMVKSRRGRWKPGTFSRIPRNRRRSGTAVTISTEVRYRIAD